MNTPRLPSPAHCFLFRSLLICVALATTPLVSYGALFSALYAFGDSLSDRGNTYQKVLSFAGSDQNVYADIDYTAAPGRYDDGRWSNGPLWIEHLNDQLGLPPLARNDGTMPLSSGANFAWGGSTTESGYKDLILSNLQNQVSQYLARAGGTASASALHSVWSGGNDVIYYIEGGSPNNPAAIDQQAATMATNIATALTTLYNAGARHFIVPNLPALGDKPTYVDTPNQAFANAIVDAFNPKLAAALSSLETQHSDIRIVDWDVYTDFNHILQNPASYGFTNVKDASFTYQGQPYPGTVVADPDSHVFWDGTHPTKVGHALLGQFAYALVVPEPSTLLLLSLALIAPCRRKRRA